MGIVRGNRFWRPRILISALAEPLFIKKKSSKNLIKLIDYYIAPHRSRTSEYNMHLSRKLYLYPRLNRYTKRVLLPDIFSFCFQFTASYFFRTTLDKRLRRYNFFKPVYFLVLQIHHLMRDIDLGTFLDL